MEDGGEEDEEELSGGEEADLRSSSGRGSLLTRRGITLRVLLKDGLVEPGDGVLAIHYLVSAQLNSQVQLDRHRRSLIMSKHTFSLALWLLCYLRGRTSSETC